MVTNTVNSPVWILSLCKSISIVVIDTSPRDVSVFFFFLSCLYLVIPIASRTTFIGRKVGCLFQDTMRGNNGNIGKDLLFHARGVRSVLRSLPSCSVPSCSLLFCMFNLYLRSVLCSEFYRVEKKKKEAHCSSIVPLF